MIRPLEAYSEQEIHALTEVSPANHRYLDLLQRHADTLPDLESRLRLQCVKSWVTACLATFHNTASTEDICLYWSKAADQMIMEAFNALNLKEQGLAVFALGKLGACELNLSSDIDLIVAVKDSVDTSKLLKPVREWLKLLSDNTPFGNGFRVDLDLRPGGPGSPLICNTRRFQDYYWTQSELWERMALVRLRPVVGHEEVIDEVLSVRDQFCYRRYLDYSLLEELKKMRPKIHRTARQGDLTEGINLKLAPGFIRDIELFINAHQIIYGGKEPQLRGTSTSQAALKLSEYEKENGLFLKLLEIYWQYRQWENQVQAINDFQTHDLNLASPPKGWKWPSFKTLEKMSSFVDAHITDLLGAAFENPQDSSHQPFLSEEKLSALGYSEETIKNVWPEVKKASVLSRQKEVDEAKRIEVIDKFIHEIAKSAFNKDLGLKGLRDFLNSVRAKATFFHLLSKEDKLVKDLSFLFGLSPYLGSLFSTRPELIDSFLFNRDEPFSNEMEKAVVQMAERKNIAEIRVALSFLSSLNLHSLTFTLTETADLICSHVLELLKKEVGCEEIFLLALGKWGGRELGFKSDLDFVFVSPNKPQEAHHRLVRRFISRLRDPSAGGSIYHLDTRLRPEGKGGALIIEEAALHEFLKHRARAWERQAYLKGRWVNRNLNFQQSLPMERGLSKEDLDELKKIRLKLIRSFTSQKAREEISLKLDEGGLVDIELALQTRVLHQKLTPLSGSTQGFFECLKMEGSFLHQHYFEIRKLEQMAGMLSMEPEPKFLAQKSYVSLISKILSREPSDLLREIRENMTKAREEIVKMDPTFS